ncbi:hypothetical protein [Pleomorphomonas sp. PLEO]|uniref:hypothetical protein n=1 Tax=Pleomorphomonas sp. PLEO TaxID=3239306 RepID=UPI00351E68C5
MAEQTTRRQQEGQEEMKIDGRLANGNYLVSMTQEEIANVAGYNSGYSIPSNLHEDGRVNGPLVLGTEFRVTKAFHQNRELFGQEKKVRDAAGMLRTLADMMEAAGPSEIIPPANEAPAESA